MDWAPVAFLVTNVDFKPRLVTWCPYIIAGNAILNGNVPVMDMLCSGQNNAYTTLDASGLSVGLPAGLMGNSEVGHLNIGAGRVLYQVTFQLFCARNNNLFIE